MPDECGAETYSWWHFAPEQVDPYWIHCTLVGEHDEHEDEPTGLKWTEVIHQEEKNLPDPQKSVGG